MNINTLSDNLKQLAISNGLCQQWQDEWRKDEDIDSLMQKFLHGIDFYISTRFISKRQCLIWFTPDDRHRHNIVVDEKRSILNPRCGIAIGNTDVTIRCNTRHVCKFYAVDNAKLNVIMHDDAILNITLCDNAEIEKLDVNPDAQVYICRASVHTKVASTDNSKIKISENFHLYDK